MKRMWRSLNSLRVRVATIVALAVAGTAWLLTGAATQIAQQSVQVQRWNDIANAMEPVAERISPYGRVATAPSAAQVEQTATWPCTFIYRGRAQETAQRTDDGTPLYEIAWEANETPLLASWCQIDTFFLDAMFATAPAVLDLRRPDPLVARILTNEHFVEGIGAVAFTWVYDDGSVLRMARLFHVTDYWPMIDSIERQLISLAWQAAAVAMVVSWLLTWAALSPVRRASRAARRIAAGDLGARLPETGADEFASLSRDVNTMADTLVTSLDAARRSTNQQRQLVADVAHELRTPLSALVASSTALEDSATRDEAAGLVAPQLRRLSAMTEGLLQLSAFDAGRQELRLDLVDAATVARDAIATSGVDADLIVAGPAHAVVDAPRVGAMLRNLLVNAQRHGEPPIRCVVAASHDALVLSVSDAGPGVPAEARATIFERFSRGDASRSTEGSGLGLAIVRENAELHGGSVTLGPDGHTFTIELPRRLDETASSPAPDADVTFL